MPHYLAILENNKEILFEDDRDFDGIEDHWWNLREKLENDDYLLSLAEIDYNQAVETAQTIGAGDAPKPPKPLSARRYLTRFNTLRIHVGAIKGIAQVILKDDNSGDDDVPSS